ncbi:hypothetical protein TREMEDRAFT_27090, partial [Tremella mesenterica DSM 1558]|uniref:uncharacterized protein n=1 Tax=Tremella mesenterica (strain ATCC 24925 / CBS 8224 / DSM 1558 / NBRC 9311 / NRRL Y-6157 / RJB 2259-6 / UBC 559-6) TaxID=578456 RepID=UPI0003F491A8
KRGTVIGFHRAGLTLGQIARKLGWPRSTIQYTVERYKRYDTAYDRPRPGRPSKMERTTRRIIRDITHHPQVPFGSIASTYNLSEPTIRRIAARHGLHRRVMRRTPFLRPQAIEKRINWAKDNVGQDWSRVIFTDEMSLELGLARRAYTTRGVGQAFDLKHLQPTFRSGRKSIMVWGAIAHNHKFPLILLPPGGLNAVRYSEIVLPKLKEYEEILSAEIDRMVLVVEDNTPCHKAKHSQQKRDTLGLHSLIHPPSSPDVNPIENLWSMVKYKVSKRLPRATNVEQLFEHCVAEWEAIDMDIVNKVVASMPRRVEAVKHAKGYAIKY